MNDESVQWIFLIFIDGDDDKTRTKSLNRLNEINMCEVQLPTANQLIKQRI